MAYTISNLVDSVTADLVAAKVDSPRLSAQCLVAHVLRVERVRLVVDAHQSVAEADVEVILSLARRRANGEPIAYLLGEKEFFGRSFRVTPDVLVPRPETEHLVEVVLEHLGIGFGGRFADLGCGSGCLAVTLACELPRATGFTIDVSEAALEVGRRNAKRHGVADRIEFRHGDMTRMFASENSLGLVVSNPPYVSEAEFRTVSNEVAGFEPKGALVPETAGSNVPDGLECYSALTPHAYAALYSDGILAVEIGCQQGDAVSAILSSAGFADVAVVKDLAGLDRVVFGRHP